MLAVLGEPFDSDDHLFEVKWDGMRAMALVDRGGWRMPNRHRREVAPRFPEFAELAGLPAGLVLDGEIIVTVDGKPDFRAMMRRAHSRAPLTARALATSQPATFMAFDLLYQDFESVIDEPLRTRRRRLAEIVDAFASPRVLLSEGIEGHGRAMFEETGRRQLEGIVAKHLDSPYRPGRRAETWVKAKHRVTAHCLIVGFLPRGENDFKSLIIALDDDGELRCVGQVGSGIDQQRRDELNRLMRARLRPRPLIPCPAKGVWVEPGLNCTVSYNERTPNGNLRAPVFVALITDD